jgi:hypothetical protein
MPAPTQPLTPDPTPAKEPSTPDETPSKLPKLPQKLTRTDTEFSSTSEMADSDDPGYQSRSRSQSRRRRRQNQRQRQAASKASASNGASTESMASIGEGNELELEPTTITRQPGQRLRNPHPSDVTEMQPFERIKPPSQSMTGPVTYARAMFVLPHQPSTESQKTN